MSHRDRDPQYDRTRIPLASISNRPRTHPLDDAPPTPTEHLATLDPALPCPEGSLQSSVRHDGDKEIWLAVLKRHAHRVQHRAERYQHGRIAEREMDSRVQTRRCKRLIGEVLVVSDAHRQSQKMSGRGGCGGMVATG